MQTGTSALPATDAGSLKSGTRSQFPWDAPSAWSCSCNGYAIPLPPRVLTDIWLKRNGHWLRVSSV